MIQTYAQLDMKSPGSYGYHPLLDVSHTCYSKVFLIFKIFNMVICTYHFFYAFLCYFYVCILFTVPPFSYYIIIFGLTYLISHLLRIEFLLLQFWFIFFWLSLIFLFFVGFKVSLQSNVCQYRFSFC